LDFAARLKRVGRFLGGQPHADGQGELQVGDPRFDDWKVVRDFEDLEAARAFRQYLGERGVDSVLTADWPLDEFGHGDIALRVPPDRWSDAEGFLEEP
jgi:hypothetical protein